MTIPPPKVDRRIQRTRQMLRDALIDLIKGQDYATITVQDITERANVNRSTFYLHYKDKDELLYKSMIEVYGDLVRDFPRMPKNPILGVDFDALADPSDFQHVAQHADFYRVILSEKGVASFVVQVRRYLATVFEQLFIRDIVSEDEQITPRMPMEFIAHFIAGAEIGVISWWLESGMKYSPEVMAKWMLYLCSFGSFWALGMTTPPPSQRQS
ncbi:MAG TPA: TetR/AcrR family transcriptional regulator [Aggregatilineales bacterium]|nr:TetR/AcrR family transcriptional regulator [Anaerolineales bacterium]HRE48669.1 TetR/AcrR family transcriptional regulator [Aggregatilineales bacterium]